MPRDGEMIHSFLETVPQEEAQKQKELAKVEI